MKKHILHSVYLSWSLLVLLMCGCNDLELESTRLNGNTLRLEVGMPSSGVASSSNQLRRVKLSESEGSKDLIAQWQDDDEVQVFIRQDNNVYDVGKIKVSDISQDGKRAVLNMDLPGMLYQNRPYTMYCFTGIDGSVQDNGDGTWFPYCRMEIQRSFPTLFRAPMFCQVEVNPMSSPAAFFKHIGTYELLHFHNKGSKSVSAVLCGFDVEKPWYQGETGVVLNDTYDFSDLNGEWDGDSESPALTIPAGSDGVFLSGYMPSGFNIQNAQLVMRIDGKVINSQNTKSSGVTIQRGHAYHMYAEWDGSELRFVNGGSIVELLLSTNTLSLTTGQQGTVDITSGSGSYDAVSNAESVATVTVDGSKLVITGVSPGSATITVKDNQTQERAKVEVTVSDSMQPEDMEAVDLGLPSGLKWANMNVGANSPEDYGDYFAWGEVTPQSDNAYSRESYKWCNGSRYTMTKYCTRSDYGNDGFTDNKTVLDAEDDAAHANWGGDWRMPTYAECQELIDNTTSEWTTQNGVNGCKFTSKTNGKSIFLPAAWRRWDGELYDAGSSGNYWSSTLGGSAPTSARYLCFGSGYVYMGSIYRDGGLSVRPVRQGSSLSVSAEELTLQVGESATVNVSGSGSYKAVSNAESVATVTVEGSKLVITGVSAGSATITVKDNQTQERAKVEVTVSDSTQPEGVEAVDLGLPSGLKWANMNVGANSPEDYGDYFAWGEVTPKSEYNWSTYKWCNGSYNTLTKYCTDSYYGNDGFVDNKTVLDAEDDAAHVNWGGDWRMPTHAECQELIDNTTSEWTSVNGVNGRKFTSKTNGKSIFLPAAGSRCYGELGNAGSYGLSWSSTLDESDPYRAWYLYFRSGRVGTSDYYRSYGQSVRPVRQN